MLDIYFLGTSSGIPSVYRGMPCIALRWQGEVILWDVGECCQRALMKHKVGYGSIRNIFISHLHLDHFLGIYGLIETLRMTTHIDSLNVFAPSRFKELLINKWPFIKLKRLRESTLLRGKDFTISAFKVKHVKGSYGFVFKQDDKIKFYKEKARKLGLKGKMFREIQEKGSLNINGRVVELKDISYVKKGIKIVYSGDTAFSQNLVRHAKNADLLIHEATFDESLEEEARETNHSTVKDAALAASKANVKHLVLTHISGRYKDDDSLYLAQAEKYFKGKITVAYDGLKITLR